MYRYGLALLLASALLVACGPGEVQQAANQAATAASGVSEADVATAVSGISEGDVATAVAEAAGALGAVANDVTLQQGQQLMLDATRSTGQISNFKWTIKAAPQGAEAVVGKTIKEASNGNVSLSPEEYAQYFPVSGTYTIELTVTDNSGTSSSDEFNIVVP